MKHTDGPWKEAPLGKGHWITGSDGTQIAVFYGDSTNPRSIADRALALAAPDLFAAAEAATVNALDVDGFGRVSIAREHLNGLYAALAKAGRR